MSAVNGIFLTFVTLSALTIKNTYGECVSETPCSCFTSTGENYDLSKILQTNNDFIGSTTVSNRTFYFHPCGNKPLIVPGKNTTDCQSAAGVSLCLYDAIADRSTSLGSAGDSRMTLRSSGQPRIVFGSTLRNGTKIVVTINLVCNLFPNVPPLLAEYKGDAVAPNYDLILVSQYACRTVAETGGLSTGTILVILFFVFVGIYFIGGATALKLLRGATGWEMLPNHKFWFDLPALVRDGIAFTFNGCKVVSYDQI